MLVFMPSSCDNGWVPDGEGPRFPVVGNLRFAPARRPGDRACIGPAVIVAAFGRSEGSGRALTYAAGLAARTGARLVVINVDDSAAALDYPAGQQDRVEDVAGEVRDLLDDALCRCEVVVEKGEPAAALRRIAGDLQADLLVVGQARHPYKHIFGSVSARLARSANQPVLIVP